MKSLHYRFSKLWVTLFGISLIAGFVLSSFLRFYIHPSGGHVHRQSDTLGMAMALAEDMRTRGPLEFFRFLYYPTILQNDLLDGINASEFPLLNVLIAPFFLISPHLGSFLSGVFILFFNLGTAYFFLGRFLRQWKIEVGPLTSVLLWFTAGTLANQTNVVMPESFGFSLVLMGSTWILEEKKINRRSLLAAAVCALGVAVKPTVAVALSNLLFWAVLINRDLRVLANLGLLTLISLILPGYWYTIHARSILSFAQGPQIFALANFQPWTKLKEAGLPLIWNILKRETLIGQFPFDTGWIWLVFALYYQEFGLLLVYLVSILLAISLDGSHIWVHGYYLIGCSLFSILLMARILGHSSKTHSLNTLFTALLFWGILYGVRINIWTWARDTNPWPIGSAIAEKIPDHYHLITDDDYLQKLLFIGRKGTAAGPDALDRCNLPKYQALNLAIVVSEERFRASSKTTSCLKKAKTIEKITLPQGKWYLILVDRSQVIP